MREGLLTAAELVASERAGQLRAAIDKVGGLATQADLARRWGISRATANQLCALHTFPAPVTTIGRSPVYAIAEADAWRRRRRGTPQVAA